MKRALGSMTLLLTFSLVPLLGSGCRLPFPRMSGRLPPGPPSKVARAPQQKDSAKGQSPRGAGIAAPAKTTKISPGSAAPQPPAPVGPRLAALIARDELEKLVASRLVFNAPVRMRAGAKERAEARIADNLYEDLSRSLKNLGIADADTIAAESSVRAALAGDGFEIRRLGDAAESASGAVFTPWIWEVTALSPGIQSLALTVTVSSKIPGGTDEKRELPVATKTVAVSAAPGDSAARFAQDNWPWIAAALLATALALWLIRRQRI
jgi:hypothetical protein